MACLEHAYFWLLGAIIYGVLRELFVKINVVDKKMSLVLFWGCICSANETKQRGEGRCASTVINNIVDDAIVGLIPFVPFPNKTFDSSGRRRAKLFVYFD